MPAGQALKQRSAMGAADFRRALMTRPYARGRYFVVHRVANDGPRSRLGLVVTRRMLPNATDRNYVKRVARESYRRQAARFQGFDVVVKLRAPFHRPEGRAARAELDGALEARA